MNINVAIDGPAGSGKSTISRVVAKKLGFKEFVKSLILDEKFYFYCAWIVAIVLWIFNSI